MDSCDHYAEALSARIDGEAPPIDDADLDRHLAACRACRARVARGEGIRRRSRLGAAPDMPDLAVTVARQAAAADRARSSPLARGLLALIAVEVMVLSIVDLTSDSHSARHLGAFSLAYGVGLLVVVVRPARARTMLPVALVIACALGITAVVDVVQGRVPLAGEALHIPEIVSVGLVAFMARRASRVDAATGIASPTSDTTA